MQEGPENVTKALNYLEKCYKFPSITSKIKILDTLKTYNKQTELLDFAKRFRFTDPDPEMDLSDEVKTSFTCFILAYFGFENSLQ